MLRRRSSDPRIVRASKAVVEALEGRQYFITLTGDAEFIFHDPEVGLTVPRQIQVNTTGNIVVELVGSSPNQFGGIDLVEIPGTLNGTGILGGVGGRGGVRLLEASGADGIDIVDPNGILAGFAGLAFDIAGNDDINFRALASTESGVMYGINVFDFSTGAGTGADRRALLVRFDNPTTTLEATVIADLTASILTTPNGAANTFAADVTATPPEAATVNGVTAAAFDPVAGGGDSTLYFVAAGGVGNRPQMFSVDVTAGSPAAIAATVTGFAGNFGSVNDTDDDGNVIPNSNNVVVHSIAFDQLSAGTSRAMAVVSRDDRRVVSGGQGVVTDRVTDLRVSTNQNNLGGAGPGRRVTFQGESVSNITGIEFANDDENAQDDLIFLITASTTTEEGLLDQGGTGTGGGGGAGGEPGVTLDPFILQGDLGQGAGDLPLLLIGALSDPADTVAPIRGEDLQGLTWNPNVTDPLTGSAGAFVAVDASSDEMVIISTARRAPDADLFHIRIVSADEDATLTVVSTEVIAGELQILPFTGAPQPFKAGNRQNGNLISVSGDSGIGRVWIGGRTLLNPLSLLPVPGFLPWIQAPLTTAFGSLSPTSSLTAGISSAPGVDMGNILIGGAITGKVDLTGSIDTFYAGWLLTGNVSGTPGGDPGVNVLTQESGSDLTTADDTFDTTNNFVVAGDAGTIISRGSIGTNTVSGNVSTYATQFDAEIGGEVGHFQSHNSLYGGVQVGNAAGAGWDPDRDVMEYETRFGNAADTFPLGLLGGAPGDFLWNDSLDNPQYVNAIGEDNINGFVRISGVLEADDAGILEPSDTYAIALLAGRTYTFQSTAVGIMSIYDPNGQRVASDASHFGTNFNQPFQFTVDRPGTYLMQVAVPPESSGFSTPYQVTVRGAGNVAVGGIVVANDVFNDRTSGAQNTAGGLVTPNDPLDYTTYVVRNGDFGAMSVGGTISFNGGYTFQRSGVNFSGRDDFRVDNGNFRVLDAGTVGLGVNLNGFGPNIEATNGDIGLLRSTVGILNIETAMTGGSMQVGDAATTGFIQLSAKVGLGVFRAGDMASLNPSIFRVNSDDAGFDGTIGLVDSQGDFGVIVGTGLVGNFIENFVVAPFDADVNPLIPGGGPQFQTGTGGNIRYINVEGQVYQDIFFGANGAANLGTVSYQPGETASYTDDGGGTIRIAALGTLTPNPAFVDPDSPDFDPLDPNIDPAATEFLGPVVSATAYGVRGSGGVVVLRAAVDGGAALEGIRITGSSEQTVDIGKIVVLNVDQGANGTLGTQLVIGANGLPTLPGASARRERGPLQLDANGLAIPFNTLGTVDQPLQILIDGTMPVNVFRAEARNSDNSYGGYFTAIRNDTRGELANLICYSVADLFSAGPLAYARPVNGVAIEGKQRLDQFVPEYPGANKANGVVLGDLAQARSNVAIGNIVALGDERSDGQGNIGIVQANADGVDQPGEFEGIIGTIYADQDDSLSSTVSGTIFSVRIGEGLAPTGSGSVPLGGIFADGVITGVTNAGDSGANIYGDIISSTRIQRIVLQNGSIINSDISVNTTFEASIEPGGGGELPDSAGPISRRDLELREISVSGNGGIIGSQISAGNIGQVVVGGFGILTSEITSLGSGFIGEVRAANYGIRYTSINAGSTLGRLIASGNGNSVSTANFPQTVRNSESAPIDSFFGTSFNPITGTPNNLLNDIHTVLGTSAAIPEIAGVTDTGVIENVDARGQGNLTTASAYQFRTRDHAAIPQVGVTFANQLNFANTIGTIQSKSLIDGLAVVTGQLRSFQPGSDVFRFLGQFSRGATSLHIRGSLGSNSKIIAAGSSGRLGNIVIDGDLDGTIQAVSRIGNITVKGVTTGSIVIGNLNGGTNISSLTAIGGIGPQHLAINGSIGKLVIGSGAAFGNTGNTLTVNGNLGSVTVLGGTLDTNLVVNGNLGSVTVNGTLVGDITVSGDVKKISVANARGAAADSVFSDVAIAGDLGTFTVRGGNVSGNVTVGGNWRSFTQTNGHVGRFDVPSGLVVFNSQTLSAGERISTFKTSGNVLANLAAGTFGSVTIGGNLGDATNAITSTAANWSLLKVLGSITTGSTTSVAGTLGNLTVGGDVQAGAVVAAAAITRKQIGGVVNGTVTP